MDKAPNAVQVLLQVTGVLERLGVDYFVAGSFASTINGRIRTTADADIVADLDAADVATLVDRLAGR